MNVVVVESPAKAKTINKYLGSNYKVLASFGHVRDLPAKDGSVRPDEDFAMSWEVDSNSSKRLSDIVKALKDSDGLILATDPDREGEAISWHVLEVLNQKKALKGKTVKRVAFNAITKKAVLDAIANPRDIDEPLMPILRVVRSTISSVSHCRRFYGANCPAHVRLVACSRSLCASSLTVSRKSSGSFAKNTGTLPLF
jgi:DNA topoisomerase IA